MNKGVGMPSSIFRHSTAQNGLKTRDFIIFAEEVAAKIHIPVTCRGFVVKKNNRSRGFCVKKLLLPTDSVEFIFPISRRVLWRKKLRKPGDCAWISAILRVTTVIGGCVDKRGSDKAFLSSFRSVFLFFFRPQSRFRFFPLATGLLGVTEARSRRNK